MHRMSWISDSVLCLCAPGRRYVLKEVSALSGRNDDSGRKHRDCDGND